MYWNFDDESAPSTLDWLTLTWDVLKYEYKSGYQCDNGININMRCIEIHFVQLQTQTFL